MPSLVRLISKPSSIPTRKCPCPYCDKGLVSTYPTLRALTSPSGTTIKAVCGECNGTNEALEDKPFIVYDNRNQQFIGWQDDQELPTGVSSRDACLWADWEDGKQDVSEYLNRYTLQVSDLSFLAAFPEK